jgi:hypothetical protein
MSRLHPLTASAAAAAAGVALVAVSAWLGRGLGGATTARTSGTRMVNVSSRLTGASATGRLPLSAPVGSGSR